MRVTFYKLDHGRLCTWVAAPPKRKPFQGTTMASGRDLPHDLAQFVVEAELGLQCGFWGLLAHGATFKSVMGRRLTKPGRLLVNAHREELNAIEHTVNAHVSAWRTGMPTPTRSPLDSMYARWQVLGVEQELVVVWPIKRLLLDRSYGLSRTSSGQRAASIQSTRSGSEA